MDLTRDEFKYREGIFHMKRSLGRMDLSPIRQNFEKIEMGKNITTA